MSGAPFRGGAAVAGAGWSGTARGPGKPGGPQHCPARDLSRPRAGGGALRLDPESLARLFPGRWNPRRSLPEGLEPLVAAFAMALEEAGWWKPGSPEPVAGGLVLGSDSHFFIAAAAFAGELARNGAPGLSPGRFLFSLPSSATALLGILFGLRDYQATATEGGLSGVRALAHSLDLLAAGRVERIAVGALSVVKGGLGARLAPRGVRGGDGGGDESGGQGGEIELGVALCLLPPGEDGGRGLPLIEGCCILDFPAGESVVEEVEGIDPAHCALAAPALLRVAAALVEGPRQPRNFTHSEPGRPGVGVIRIGKNGEER